MPIDIGSGAVYQQAQDISIQGRYPLVWDRKYHSNLLHEKDSPLGPGWSSPYFAKLTRIGRDYHFRSPAGALIVFPDSQDSVDHLKTIRDTSSFHEIAKRGGYLAVTQWTVSGQVTRYLFKPDRNGQWWPLRFVEDAAGNGIELAWDDLERLKGLRQKHEKRTLSVSYSSSGRIASIGFRHSDGRESILTRYDYNAKGGLSTVQDALGASVRFEYDGEGRLSRELAKDGGVSAYKYDDKGRCIRYSGLDNYDLKILRYLDHIGWTEVTNSLGATRRYERLPNGQLIQEIDPLGGKTLTEYDDLGRIISKTDPMGGKTSFAFDEMGDRSKIIDALGNETVFEHNDQHLITCEIDANGGRWDRKYDGANRPISFSDPTGFSYSIEYDHLGNQVTLKKSDGSVSKRTFSGNGDLKESTDWMGRTTEFNRDEFGRVIRRRDPDGSEYAMHMDGVGRITQTSDNHGRQTKFEYDIGGNLIRKSGKAGPPVLYRYGPCHRLLEKINEAGHSVRYGWGSEPDRLESVTNEKGEIHSFFYDPCDRVNKETDFDGRSIAFKFDLCGRCIRKTNGLGQHINWALDPLGRLLEETVESEKPSVYEYDKLGNLISAENAWSKQTFTRDAIGRILKEGQGGFGIQREFDEEGKLRRMETDAGIYFGYTYDENGRLDSLDANGLGSFTFNRNARNQTTEVELPGNLKLWQTYDSRGRLLTQTVSGPELMGADPESRIVRGYVYDDSDMLLSVTDGQWGKTRFTHDEIKRLIQFGGQSNKIGYQLGSTGEPSGLLVDSDTQISFAYGPGGSLLSKGSLQYEYDAAGRLVSVFDNTENDPSRKGTYQWDAKDRLLSFQTPSGETWEYGYDPFGRRVAKKGANREIQFVWDANILLHEIEKGLETKTWGFEIEGYNPLFRIQSGKLCSIIRDRMGTAREMVDPGGKVFWSLHLDPWGNPIEGKGQHDDCPFRFQGQYYDAESGLHYSTFRYYDPKSGRFVSKDPIRLHGGLNSYQYVPNHLHWVDPLGLCPEDDAAAEKEKLAALQAKLEALAEEHLLPKLRAIDPNLEAGYTGSFKTGTVGNPSKETFGQPVNLNKFDIDYWVKSDTLFEQQGSNLKADPAFRQILSDTPGFEGLKPNKEGFSIKFKPSD